MKIVTVGEANLVVYLNLAQSYEGEFSGITKKRPNARGLFELDTQLKEDTKGYLLYVDGIPAGLAAVAMRSPKKYEVCEFYVVPFFRNQYFGMRFAHGLWQMLPGSWEVKQISGAEYAIVFWRKAISKFAHRDFSEDRYEDPYWGWVTRQRFSI